MTPPLLPEIGEDSEFEATVVARPLKRDGPVPSGSNSLLDDIRPGAGPAANATARREFDEPENQAPRRSLLPVLLLALAATFIGATVLAGGGALLWFTSEDAPAQQPPTLGDVVGAEADGSSPAPAPAPEAVAAATEAPAVASSPASPAAAAPAATVPPTAAAPAPPTATTTSPVTTIPPAPAPTAKATAAPPAAKATAASAPKTTTSVAAPEVAATGAAPVRIGQKAPETATAPPAAATPAPAASTNPTPPPATEPPSSFRVEFASADPALTLEVKCTQGSGNGAVVVIDDATKGNCRVTGRGDTGTVMTLVTVSAARSYRCFAGGARTCQ